MNDASIIDVYRVKDGRYQFSFYLPNVAGKKVNDFKVCGNKLITIYDQYLTVYELDMNVVTLAKSTD